MKNEVLKVLKKIAICQNKRSFFICQRVCNGNLV